MASIDHLLIQTCTKIVSITDGYGEQTYSSEATLNCKFRHINELNRVNYQENTQSDAMLWVKADSGVELGTIVLFEDVYYRVERIIKAREMYTTNVKFIKCLLQKYTTNVTLVS